MALTKLTTDLIDGSLGTDWQATPKTADFTAVAGEGYFVNTTSAAITVTLPSSPTAGDEVSIVDYAGTAATNNITITSSDNINGSSNDVKIDYERGGVSMVYVDATQGWIAYSANNETAESLIDAPPEVDVDYLVVAGGGGTGTGAFSGGAGAGGLLTGAAMTVTLGISYDVTVGAGGSGATAGNSYSNIGVSNGSNSIFNTVTSTGGGYGSTYVNNSGSGGSGGGEAAQYTHSIGTGIPGQGNNGGIGPGNTTGGGGGAGAVGGTGSSSQGGNGGVGLSIDLLNSTNAAAASVGEVSGSDVYYAGGGAGSRGYSSLSGSGGLGGGGGDNVADSVAVDGTLNTGGGGGGTAGQASTVAGAAGGSGVVILRYPSAYQITVGSGITEASGSPFTESTDKVSVFTGGTGTISFS